MGQKNDTTTYSLPIIDDINSIWGFGNIVMSIGDWVSGLGGSNTSVSSSDAELLKDMQDRLNSMDDSLTNIMKDQDLTEAQLRAISNVLGQNTATLNEINGKLDALQDTIITGFQQIQVALDQISKQNVAIMNMLSDVMNALEVLNKKINILQASLGYGISYNAIVSPTQKIKYTNTKLAELNNVTEDSSDEDAVKNFLLLQDFAKEVSNPGADGIEAALDALYNTCVGNEFLTSSLTEASFNLLLQQSEQPQQDLYRIVLSLLNIFVSGYGTLATCQMLANRPVVSAESSKEKVDGIINNLILVLKKYVFSNASDEYIENPDVDNWVYIDSSDSEFYVRANEDDDGLNRVIVNIIILDDGRFHVKSARVLKNHRIDESTAKWNYFTPHFLPTTTSGSWKSLAKRDSYGLTELLKGFSVINDESGYLFETKWISYNPITGELGEIRVDSQHLNYGGPINDSLSTALGKGALGGESDDDFSVLFSGIEFVLTSIPVEGMPSMRSFIGYDLKEGEDPELLNSILDEDDFTKFGRN